MNTFVLTTTTPTTTDSRTNRRLDDPLVPSLLEDDLQREGNKRKRLSSIQIREAASSNNKIRLVDCMGIPDAVYPLIWSFLLDSAMCSHTASSLDFQSILQFMVVNKSSKGAFDDCRGWWLSAEALKREAEAKLLLIVHFGNRACYVEKFCEESPTYAEEIERARQMNSRMILIQSALLPEASRLAVLYGSEEVSMDEYRSIAKFIDRVDYFVFLKYGAMRQFLRTLDRVTSSLESVVYGNR
jgi:hypothetical protein